MTIRGSGGGGGKDGGGGGTTRAPIETPDNLHSIEYARELHLISEGEIGGFFTAEPLKSIELDGVAIMNSDGSMNFSGVTFDYRLGTQNQSPIGGFASLESEHTTGLPIQLLHTTPIVRTVTNNNVDQVRITLGFPTLTFQDPTTGDLSGNTVEIAIDIQTNGGGYVTQGLADGGVISGKTVTRYQRSYLLSLPKPGSGPWSWDIRVRRNTGDTYPANEQKQSWWDSYTEIINTKFAYPNSALGGIQIDSSQFNRLPSVGFYIYGRKVQIPSNYNPHTRVYTGIWDGTFVSDWTNNPVWIWNDMLTNTRFGLGRFIDQEQVDKFSLYTIAQYCDELVSDGFGGLEPRFICGLYLQQSDDAYVVMNNMASVFRAMAYWINGSITAIQDSPRDPDAIYGPSNVIDANFSYQGSALHARHTVALVTYNDPNDHFKQAVEYVEDPDGIARYGVNPIPTQAMGSISRGQAHRWGRWLLYSERLEFEVNTFEVGMDGIFSPPGSVIWTNDPSRAGLRFSGRNITATVNSVTLDESVNILAGHVYTISAMLPDGVFQTRAVSNAPGVTNLLTTSSNFTQAPQDLAVWVLAQDDLNPEVWRVVSTTESKGIGFQITGISHNPSKYAFVENDLTLETPETSNLNVDTPDTPTGLVAVDMLYQVAPNVGGSKVVLSWNNPQRDVPDSGGLFVDPTVVKSVTYWLVGYKPLNGNWTEIRSRTTTVDFPDVLNVQYDFYVVAVNKVGRKSQAATTSHTIAPEDQTMSAITGFSVSQNGGAVLFSWDQNTDFALKGYDIAYAPQGETNWSNFTLLTESAKGTEMTNASVPPGTWSFGIRARGVNDQLSPTFPLIDLIVVNESPIIYRVDEAPDWEGTLVNLVKHYTGILIPEGTKTCDTYTQISAPSVPTLSSVIGGSLGLTTYYVVVTYTTETGGTVVSSEASLAVPALSLLKVTSPAASTGATGWNVYVSVSSTTETKQNTTPIAIGTDWTEMSSGLVAGASQPTTNTTGWEVFDAFVPDPVATATYTTNEIDTGYDETLRVFSTTDILMGPNQTGSASYATSIDTWLTGDPDPVTFTAWSIGTVDLRYLRERLSIGSIVAGSVPYVNSFIPTIDTSPKIEHADNIVVVSGGTVVTFPTRYHEPPNVQLTATSAGSTGGSAVNITEIDFVAFVFNGTTDTGGTANWTSTGV